MVFFELVLRTVGGLGDDVLRGKIPPHSIEHGVAEGSVTRAEHALRLCNILRVADLPSCSP